MNIYGTEIFIRKFVLESTIEEGKTTTVDLVMRDNAEEIRVIGNFNSEATYLNPETKEEVP